jgi:hypothetical protein
MIDESLETASVAQITNPGGKQEDRCKDNKAKNRKQKGRPSLTVFIPDRYYDSEKDEGPGNDFEHADDRKGTGDKR